MLTIPVGLFGSWHVHSFARGSRLDSRSVQAFITALEWEAVPGTRSDITLVLGFWPDGDEIDEALEEVSQVDEDARVRWAARYALLMRQRHAGTRRGTS